MMNLTQEKVEQAKEILVKNKIDLWLTFVRETSACHDPILSLLYGDHDLTWPSALIITAKHGSFAILGRYEAQTALDLGAYDHVIPYDQGVKQPLLNLLDQIKPRNIAINTSQDDVLSDGLTHGMYLTLMNILDGTEYKNLLVSADSLSSELRGCKTPLEVNRIKQAISSTQRIFNDVFEIIHTGMTEFQVAELMHEKINSEGLDYAWTPSNCPIVNTGPNAAVGHNAPTNTVIQPGHILHFDFGVKEEGYCADLQRIVYFPQKGDHEIPVSITKAFKTVREAIQSAFNAIVPGKTGTEIDFIARSIIIDAGYPEYMHATGHQLGQLAHDGGALIGPEWERYGKTPKMVLEKGQVFTLELGVNVAEHGYVGLEEDILITEEGAIYLSQPQTDLLIL